MNRVSEVKTVEDFEQFLLNRKNADRWPENLRKRVFSTLREIFNLFPDLLDGVRSGASSFFYKYDRNITTFQVLLVHNSDVVLKISFRHVPPAGEVTLKCSMTHEYRDYHSMLRAYAAKDILQESTADA